MKEVEAAPIGKSLQEDDHDNTNSNNHLERIPADSGIFVKNHGVQVSQDVTSKCWRSLLLPDADMDVQRKRSRIMLTGPAKSGKSSLAMNFAYSKAISAAPCLCLDARLCRCNAVTMYRPVLDLTKMTTTSLGNGPEASTTNNLDSVENFPLICRYIDAPEELSKQLYEDAQESIEWDPHLLKQIRVHRISNVRELLQDLLSMLGKPLQEQPRSGGAIIIEDLDKIVAWDVGMCHGNSHWSASTSTILQIGRYCTTEWQCNDYDALF
jgi:hypothetical protein